MHRPATSAPTDLTCRACNSPVRGRFCANCGALTEAATCAACSAPLEPGDRHCSQCGASVGGAGGVRRARAETRTAWIVAGIAFVSLVATVLLQRASDRRAGDAAAVAESAPIGQPAAAGGLTAQDIAAMPAREQMDRLFDRIMRLRQEGKTDSVRFFAPMVLGLYDRPDLQPLDADLRYDLGTVANAAGSLDVERAQADTILAGSPTHLLGLLMAARNARARGDETAARSFETRLVAAEQSERAAKRPEYERHAEELQDALAKAKKSP